MKVLVLGSAGQIGAPTVKFLINEGYDVVEYDIETSSDQDLRHNSDELINIMNDCDFVYFFACDVGGAKYLEKYQNTYEFIDNNLRIMVNVFSGLKTTGKSFIYTSSMMAALSNSTYGMLKLVGEKMAQDIGGLSVRLWNVYGNEKLGDKAHVITDFIDMAHETGVIKMRTDGKESRQLLHVDDCVNAFKVLTENYDKLDKSKNYHITNFEWTTILDVAKTVSLVCNASGIVEGKTSDRVQLDSKIEPDPFILNYWQPKISLYEGITKIYNENYVR